MKLLRRLAGLFGRERLDRELDEELASHLALHIEDNLHGGMSPEEARRQALLKLGGLESTKESYRDQRGIPFIETTLRDLSYAARSLRRAPLFTGVAVLSLALGIGASSAIFSLTDQMLIRTLPVPEPHRLVFFQWKGIFIGGTSRCWDQCFSYPGYRDMRANDPGVFTGMAARRQERVDVSGGDLAQRAIAEVVSGNYFDVLRVGAALGRTLKPEDDMVRDASPHVALGYGFWQRAFGGRLDILGRAIHVNGHPMTVIGVAERGFSGVQVLQPTDLFVPMSMKTVVTPTWDDRERRDTIWLNIVARLRSGVTLEQAAGAMQNPFRIALQNDVEAVRGDRTGKHLQRYLQTALALQDGSGGYQRGWFRTPAFVLLSMAGLLLLVACANVANLLIARAANRRKEIAIRASLGASRARLVRLMAAEAVSVGVAAGAIGLLVSVVLANLLIALLPSKELAAALHATPDWRVAGFTAVLSLFTSLLFGIAPAVHASRADVSAALKEEATSASSSRGQARFRKLLVATQVALALTLLVGAGLFSRSLGRLMSVDPGVVAGRLLTFSVDPSLHRYTPERARQLYLAVQQKLALLPGVQSASGASERVLGGRGWENTVGVEGYRPRPDEDMQADWNQVMPGFFATIGAPILAGRDFTERDSAGAPHVAIVNETFVRRFCGGTYCVGRRIGFGGGSANLNKEIVGVVKDVRNSSLNEAPRPWTVTPALQNPKPAEMSFYLRTPGRPEALGVAARN
ncbi:MAG: ABC transporter permease, partial [Bryobacteraceae bacterium]|nr:ABC transporter permease [Bryobacteraceae bacterium]